MTPTEFAVKTLYWFFLYGFIGWGVEVVYAAIKTHKLVNRGFLCGPICPIYGFGMVGLIYSVSLIPMPDSGSMSAVAIFFIGMILTTAIELVGGWALFKIYHIRWWDYSNMKFNLGGYICPQFSLLWGLGSVLMIKVVHPLLARGSSPMPFNIMLIVDVVLLVLFVVDVAASTAAAIMYRLSASRSSAIGSLRYSAFLPSSSAQANISRCDVPFRIPMRGSGVTNVSP